MSGCVSTSGTQTVSRCGHRSLAGKPLSWQTSICVISPVGRENQAEPDRAENTSNITGAAYDTPVIPARPSPSLLPTQTATT